MRVSFRVGVSGAGRRPAVLTKSAMIVPGAPVLDGLGWKRGLESPLPWPLLRDGFGVEAEFFHTLHLHDHALNILDANIER